MIQGKVWSLKEIAWADRQCELTTSDIPKPARQTREAVFRVFDDKGNEYAPSDISELGISLWNFVESAGGRYAAPHPENCIVLMSALSTPG